MIIAKWKTAAALAAVVAAGCGSSREQPRVIGRELPEVVFERGMNQLERKRWTEAIATFERLVLEYPGFARTQEARLRIGDAYMGRKEYVTAAGEYLRLAGDFPAGQLADDARFGACDAYRHLSPEPYRDSQYSTAAIEHCEALIAYYPTSEFTPRAQAIVREMKEKLAEKIYLGGEFYRKRGAPDAAIIYYDDVVELYPQASFAPRALLRLVEVYHAIGYREEAQTARDRLLKDYPNTPEAQQVQSIPLATGP